MSSNEAAPAAPAAPVTPAVFAALHALCAQSAGEATASFQGTYRDVRNDSAFDPNHVNLETGKTMLYAASESGNPTIVRQLLGHSRINVNMKCRDGQTALSAAALRGHANTACSLLEHPGINVNAQDDDGWTALASAAGKFHAVCVELLLRHPDIDPRITFNDGVSPLQFLAQRRPRPGCESRWRRTVKLLLSHSLTDVNVRLARDTRRARELPRNGEPAGMAFMAPLSLAVQFNSDTAVSLFLEHPDVDVNPVGAYSDNHESGVGASPVYIAAKYGNVPVMRLLLAHPGIDVNIPDTRTGVHIAKFPLQVAVPAPRPAAGSDTVLSLLLAHPGVKVNQVNANKKTALHSASHMEDPRATELLLTHPDTDVNALDIWGKSALCTAVATGRVENVALLLAHPEINTSASGTGSNFPLYTVALHWARPTQSGYEQFGPSSRILELLLAHPGIDVDQRKLNKGTSPLMLACKLGNAHMVSRLCQHHREHGGLDINAADSVGRTALHTIVSPWKGIYTDTDTRIYMAQCLIDHGADATLKNSAGLTPALVPTTPGVSGEVAAAIRNASSARTLRFAKILDLLVRAYDHVYDLHLTSQGKAFCARNVRKGKVHNLLLLSPDVLYVLTETVAAKAPLHLGTVSYTHLPLPTKA